MSNRESELYFDYLKDLQRRIETLERFGGGGGAFGNMDGGEPDTNYGGISSIDAGDIGD